MQYDRGLCDVDGVLADFTGHLLNVINSTLTREDITAWDIFGFLSDEEAEAANEVLKHGEFWRSLPVISGAQDGFETVRSQAREMFWLTSPWDSCEVWVPARKAWLVENFNADPKNVITAAKKYPVSGGFFIDDKPAHIEAHQSEHPECQCFLFDGPHNQDSSLERMDWSNIPTALGG